MIQENREFVIKEHRIERFLGQKRTPNIIQSNGFYSIVTGQPEHEVSLANDGKGSWIEYGRASQWEFQDGLCSMYLPEKDHLPENLIWTITFDVSDEDNCELETIEPEVLEVGNTEDKYIETLREHWWEIIEGIKECETRFIEQGKRKEAEQLAICMDRFYPKDVVGEILSDREGEVIGMAEEKTLFPDEYYYFIGTQEQFYSFRRVTEKDIQWVLDEISILGFLSLNISEEVC